MTHQTNRTAPAVELSRQAEIFQALSTEIRLAVVLCLYEGDLAVNELIESLDRKWPGRSHERTNISKHLTVLRSAGIVSCRGDAQRRIYRLETPCLVDAIGCAAGADAAGAQEPKSCSSCGPAEK